MEMRTTQYNIEDAEILKRLDNILDVVLELKSHLMDSNRDSNSLGGISIPLASSGHPSAKQWPQAAAVKSVIPWF